MEKRNRVFDNTTEVVTKEEFSTLCAEKPDFKFYYGTAPTGPFHIGYLVPLGKVLDLARAGGRGTVLIADYHAYLDDRKTPWEEMTVRSEYYRICVEKCLGDFAKNIKIILGSSFQSSREYVEDVFKLAGLVTYNRALRAASEVVRIISEPRVSSALYPIMQTVDVKHLGSRVVVGGLDQRHIYMLSREILPEVNWKKPVCFFTPLIASLKGPEVKMSASIAGSFIRAHEKDENLKALVKSAYCPQNIIEKNPIAEIARYIVLPFLGSVSIERPTKFGGNVVYKTYSQLESHYEKGLLHPVDLKNGVYKGLAQIIKPIREAMEKEKDLQNKICKTYGWSEF